MARKAPNGFGSIRKVIKSGKTYFEGRYTDPILHKQKSVSAKTEKECRQKLQEIQSKIFTGQYVTPQKQTVGVYLDDWIKNRVSLEESTRELYERNIRLYIKPIIGDVRIQELRYVHCQEMVRKLSKDPGRKKQLSPKSVRNAAGILSKALADAVKAEIIASNPAADLELPAVPKTPPKVLQSQQQTEFIHAVQASPYKRIFLVGLYTGMRISEVLGLKWDNVNFKSYEIIVDSQLNRKKRDVLKREIKSTKTHRWRTIAIPEYVVDVFKEQSLKQKEWRLKAGPLWQNNDGLVFTREDGSPMPHNTVSNAFKRIVDKMGHHEWSFHSLRHTFVTDELRSGTDVKTVAVLAGHSTTSFTLDTYAAATDEMKEAAARRRQEAYEKANA